MFTEADKQSLILQPHNLGAVQFGNFTMASGLQSPIYVDLRRMIARPSLLKHVARAYAELLEPLTYDHLAAVPYGALAIGTAVSLLLERPFIFPRKEVKTHGTGRIIEGLFEPGDKVVIIEDLVTKGGSALKAVKTLEEAGLLITDIVVTIDRGQGGRQIIEEAGYHLHAILTMAEVLETLETAGKMSGEQVTAVKNYLATM
jgi:uridine monophosphate synthetase